MSLMFYFMVLYRSLLRDADKEYTLHCTWHCMRTHSGLKRPVFWSCSEWNDVTEQNTVYTLHSQFEAD